MKLETWITRLFQAKNIYKEIFTPNFDTIHSHFGLNLNWLLSGGTHLEVFRFIILFFYSENRFFSSTFESSRHDKIKINLQARRPWRWIFERKYTTYDNSNIVNADPKHNKYKFYSFYWPMTLFQVSRWPSYVFF